MEKVKLKIYGMSCEDCKLSIEKNLKRLDGIVSVNISLKNNLGEVILDESKINKYIIPNLEIFSGRSKYRARVIENEKL